MPDHSPSFAYLLETDLARKGLSQRELAAKMTEQGEPPLTEQAISSWKARGKAPARRMARLLEILGPDSEVGKAQAKTPQLNRFGGLQDNTAYPKRDEARRVRDDARPVRDNVHPAREGRITFPGAPFNRVAGAVVEQEIRDALPEEFRGNFDKAIPVGAVSLRFDYISDHAVLEIKQISGTYGLLQVNVYRNLFQLALASRILGSDRKQRNYGLVVIAPAEARMPGLERSRLEAALMGLQLVVVDGPEAAAQQIEEWEKHPPEDLFSS